MAAISLSFQYYKAKSPWRQRELEICLSKNLKAASQAECSCVIIFLEDDFAPELSSKEYSCRVLLVHVGRRLRFKDWLNYIIKNFDDNSLHLLMNSDIFITPESLHRIIVSLDCHNTLVALSRYEIVSGGLCAIVDQPSLMQDAWVVMLNKSSNLLKNLSTRTNFSLGLPGCDNRFAGAAWEIGMNVSNPSLAVQTFHVHAEETRSYSELDRIYGIYFFPACSNDFNQFAGTPAVFISPRHANPESILFFSKDSLLKYRPAS